jgi:hydroxymethylglutaryl-CoA lyase
MTSLLPKSVTITDDTMREGLQIESPDIPVAEKLRLLDALGETGAKVISIGSFAHPKWTPSMACIDDIAEQFVPKSGVKYTAAVFNKRGFDRADAYYPKIDVRGRRFGAHVELCDSFARRNYNRTQAQQIAGIDASVAGAKQAGAEAASVAIGNAAAAGAGARLKWACVLVLMVVVVSRPPGGAGAPPKQQRSGRANDAGTLQRMPPAAWRR